MLRSKHAILKYDFKTMRVHPDRLHQVRHANYLSAMRLCLRFYQQGQGRTRQWLHRRVEETLSQLGDCPPRRVAAFCKLLDDASDFASDRNAAVRLRKDVFTAAAPLHPIVTVREGIFEHEVDAARRKIAA